jgi:hypothetical protein
MAKVADELLAVARRHHEEVDVAGLEEYDSRIRPAGTLDMLFSAVSRGSTVAMTALGCMKYRGIVLDKDKEEGMRYLMEARERGSRTASEWVEEIADATAEEPRSRTCSASR